MKKKRIIIIIAVCLAVVAVVGTIFGVKAYNDYVTQQQIEERIKSIEDTYADFEAETDRNKKLEILSDFIKNKPSTNDEISELVLSSVEPKYSETIGKMQKYFTDDYDKAIKENTISTESLDKNDDKEEIQAYIDELESLEKTIKSEKDDVFYSNDESSADDFLDKTDELIDLYNDRIKKIEKAEKEKEEAAKKAAEEKKNQKTEEQSTDNNDSADAYDEGSYSSDNGNNSYDGNSNSSYSGDDSYSSGSSSYEGSVDSNTSGGSDSGSGTVYWYRNDETGHTTYRDENGNCWDNEGNTWTVEQILGI